jgi:hypothetical protein
MTASNTPASPSCNNRCHKDEYETSLELFTDGGKLKKWGWGGGGVDTVLLNTRNFTLNTLKWNPNFHGYYQWQAEPASSLESCWDEYRDTYSIARPSVLPCAYSSGWLRTWQGVESCIAHNVCVGERHEVKWIKLISGRAAIRAPCSGSWKLYTYIQAQQ